MIVLTSTVITRNLSGRQDNFSNIIYCQVIDTRFIFYGCNVVSAYLIPDRCKVTSCSRIILFHRPGRSCASIWPRSDIVCQDLAVSCYNVLVRNCTVIISVAIRPSSTCRTDFCFQLTLICRRCPLACVIVHRVASRQFQEVDISTATVRIFKLSYIDGKLLSIKKVLLIAVINIVSVFEFCRTYRLTFNCRILNIFLRGERYHIIARLNRPSMIVCIKIRIICFSCYRIRSIQRHFNVTAITIDRICFIFICQFCHPVICIAAITVICFGQICNQNCKRREAVGRERQVTIAGNCHFQLFQISALMEDFYVCRRSEVQTGNGNFAGLLKLKTALIFGADIECIKGVILF